MKNIDMKATEDGKIIRPDRLPWVIPMSCEGCGACVNACIKGHLKMTETNVEGVFVPWLENPLKCSGCGRCGKVCAMGAISMTGFVDMAMKRFLGKKPVIIVEENTA